jgi:hypothetical protein
MLWAKAADDHSSIKEQEKNEMAAAERMIQRKLPQFGKISCVS